MASPLSVGGAEQNAPEGKISRSEPRGILFHGASRIGMRKTPGAVRHGHSNIARADQTGGAKEAPSTDPIKPEKKGPVSVVISGESPMPSLFRPHGMTRRWIACPRWGVRSFRIATCPCPRMSPLSTRG